MFEVLKFVCLFLGVWFSIITVGSIINKVNLSSANLFVNSISVAGFIYIQWIM